MKRMAMRVVLVAALSGVFAASGCESGKRSESADQPVGAEESDAARAERAIERDQRENRGERRPYSEPQRPPVDQPRPAGRP